MESGINHHLFGKNNSTETHWYPRHGDAIKISELHINNVAAIIDLYEEEAVKFLIKHIGASSIIPNLSEFEKRRAPIVNNFLLKNVPAWNALKNREMIEKLTSLQNWKRLFVKRDYYIPDTPPNESIKPAHENRKESNLTAKQKALLHLKVIDVKIKLSEIQGWIDKNL